MSTKTPEQYLQEGESFLSSKEYDKAFEAFKNAIEQDPHYSPAYYKLQTLVETNKEFASVAKPLFLKGEEAIPNSANILFYLAYCCSELGENGEAKKHYEKVLSLDPKDHVAANNLGLAYKALEEYEKAFDAFKIAIEQKPDFILAYNNLKNFIINNNKYALEAKPIFLKGVELNPDSGDLLFDLAYCCHEIKEYSEAKKYYEKVLHLAPDNYAAAFNLGLTNGALKEYKKALEAYKKAISIKPDYTTAFENILDCFEKTQEINEGINYFKVLLESDPQKEMYAKQPDVWFNLAYLLNAGKKYNESLENYKKVISSSPDFEQAYNNIKLCFERTDRLKECISYLKTLVENHPQKDIYAKQSELWYALGYCSDKLEQFEEAIEYYKKGLAIKVDIDSFYDLKKSYEKAEKIEEGITFFKEITDKTLQKDAYNNLFNLLYNNKKLEDAISYAKEISKKTIDFKEDIYLIIASYCNLIDKNDDSISFFRSIIEKDKKDALAHRYCGWAYAYTRQFDEALEHHQKALSINSSAENQYELGNAHLDMLHYKEAIDCFNKVLEMDKDFIYAAHNKNFIIERQVR